jgi:hypothetical protein
LRATCMVMVDAPWTLGFAQRWPAPPAQHSEVVHATVLVETRIFNGQYGIGHDFGNFCNRSEVAALITKLPNQITL